MLPLVSRAAFLLGLALCLSQCATLPRAIQTGRDPSLNRTEPIYVVSHGWHTGIVIPSDTLANELPSLEDRFPDARYLELGWGDKEFYQSEKITSGIGMRAVFLPSDTVVHVVAVPNNPQSSFPHSKIRKLLLHPSEARALAKYLSSSFSVNQPTEIIQDLPGLYGDSQFYQGHGHYHLFNTCNKWTAKGLRSAGLPIRPMFKLSASSITDWIDESGLAVPAHP